MVQSLGRILFIEDHPDVREALSSLLEDFGYQVEPVSSAEDGLARLEAGGRFDLLVSDFSLPGQSGAWLIHEAEARGLIGRERALIVTALPHPPGCEGLTVLHKPLDISYFLEEVAGKLPKARLAPPAPVPVTPEPPRVELAFYMSSGSTHSHKALKSLETVLDSFNPAAFRLQVCDLSHGSHAQAEQDKVSYTPTLVKRAPLPRSWLVGDMRDREKLASILGSWGVELKAN